MPRKRRGKKSKAGKVYVAEVTSKSGKKSLYTGQTSRSVPERISEHKAAQKSGASKTFVGKGESIKLLGSIFSQNRHKAEKTIKGFSPAKKRNLAKRGARNFIRKK